MLIKMASWNVSRDNSWDVSRDNVFVFDVSTSNSETIFTDDEKLKTKRSNKS